MKSCEKYQELISASIDNELSDEEKAELAEHLKGCSECAALYRAFTALSSSIEEDLEQMPPELHENIMAEIRRSDIKKKNKKLSKPLKTIIASAACAVIIVGAAFIAAPKGAQTPAAVSLGAGEEAEAALAPESYSSGYDSATDFDAAPEEAYTEAAPETEEFQAKSAPDMLQSAAPPVMFSAVPEEAASYELNQEQWDSFRSLITEDEVLCSDAPESLSEFRICLSSCPESSYIEVFNAPEGLIYYDSFDKAYHLSGSDFETVTDFLDIL